MAYRSERFIDSPLMTSPSTYILPIENPVICRYFFAVAKLLMLLGDEFAAHVSGEVTTDTKPLLNL
jgi:hypothetical protein